MIPPNAVLSRDSAVLVLIDMQERLASAMSRRDAVVSRALLLLRVASVVGLPVVVTRQYPQGLGATVSVLDEVASALAAEGAELHVVDKVDFDCFSEPGFVDAICRTGRRQILLAGMETHICVAQTALSGVREGYDVHVAADACCSRDHDSHTWALTRLGLAGAAISTAESAAYELVRRAGTDEFRALLAAVKECPN